jgi:hypothetical protein
MPFNATCIKPSGDASDIIPTAPSSLLPREPPKLYFESYAPQPGATSTSATMATGVDAKLLKTTKFPPEFNQKVDMTKVNLQVMKKYVLDHS